jgi:2'-5' RNA ligase
MYYDVVKPHITLVFGTEKLNLDQLRVHALKILDEFRQFRIVLDRAQVVEDNSKKFFHTFLIPSVGYDEIIRLHDSLYTYELQSELRLDIPFIPHIGIGTSENKDKMQSLVQFINKRNIRIEGLVESLSVVQYDGTTVTDRHVLELS